MFMLKTLVWLLLLLGLVNASFAQCRLDYSNYIPIFTETFDGIDSVNQLSPAWKFWYPDDSAQGIYYGWLSEMWSKKNISFVHEKGKDFVRLTAKRLRRPVHCTNCPDVGNYKGEKKYVSGMLELVAGEDSGAGFTYGIFEASLRFSDGSGAWPAFWMVGSGHPVSLTEIDIVDGYFSNDRVWKSNLLDWSYPGGSAGYGLENRRRDDDLTRNFHLFSLVWTPQKLAYFLDGWELFTLSNPVDSKEMSPRKVYARPEKLVLLFTMQMAEWASVANAHMDIDYVKVYKPCSRQDGGCKPLQQLTPYDYNTIPYIKCNR
jgi:hypothetical protein